MRRPSAEGKPIDTPSASVYIQQVKTFFQDDPVSEPGYRTLELIQGLAVTVSAVYADVKRDVEEISGALKRNPKLIRDINAVLPRGLVVQCPVDVAVLEYMVLMTSDGGQILSTSGPDGIGVPCPSSTRELRVTLPLKDEWESIQTTCSGNAQWGSCLSQLLQREYEDPQIDEDYKRVVSRRQVHLAKSTRILPPSLFLHNLVRSEAIYQSDYGAFADIAKATINETPVCLKILRVYQDDRVKKSKAFFREVLLWSRLSHPNILPFLGAQVSEGFRFVLISPWMNNGNLRAFLKANPDHDRLKSCFQISCGLKYLHGLIPPIYHRDVKAVNVVVKDDGQCCLADFGLSSIAGSQRLESKSYAGEGTMHWQAPEVVLSDSSESFEKTLDSAAADVYAYGCTVFEIYTGNHPFHDLKEAGLIRAHMENRKPEFPGAINLDISKKFRALVCSCWNSAPERPTMSTINSSLKVELASREAPGSRSVLAQSSDEECLAAERPMSTEYTLRKPESTNMKPSSNFSTRLDEWEDPVVKNRVYFGKPYRSPSPSPSKGSYDQRRSVITPSNIPKTEDPRSTSGPAKITSNGLVTPPTNDHAPVDPAPLLAEPKPRLTEEPEAMKHIEEDLAPRLGIHTDNLLTPPETPTLSPGRTSVQPFSSPLRPESPAFVPRMIWGVKAPKARELSADAAEFRPSRFLLRSSTLQSFTTAIPSSTTSVHPATPTSPLARHSSLSQSSLNVDAVEFTPNRSSVGDKLPPVSALRKQETRTSSLNPNASPFNLSAAT